MTVLCLNPGFSDGIATENGFFTSEKFGANFSSWSYDIGRSCEEMCGKTLRTCEQSDSTVTQSRNSKSRGPSIQRRKNRICWRIVKSVLTNCSLNVCVLGSRIGRLDILMVCESSLLVSIKKWTESAWQTFSTFSTFDLEHSSHKWIQTIFSCGKCCTSMSIGTISRFWFGWWPRRVKINIRSGILCIFGSHTFVPTSWMCKKQTSVSHGSPEAEIISLDARVHAWMESRLLHLWNLFVVSVLFMTPKTNPIEQDQWSRIVQGNLSRIAPRQASAPRTKPMLQPRTTVLICFAFTMCFRMAKFFSVQCNVCCTCLRTIKPSLRW